MKAFAGKKHGASKRNLLLIYRAFIRSVIDYGSFMYDPASITNLKILDTIQYKSLLLITGGIRGTPLSTLLAECGEMPLKNRRSELLLKFLLKGKYVPTNSAKIILNSQKFPSMGITNNSLYADKIKSIENSLNLQNCITNTIAHKVSVEKIDLDDTLQKMQHIDNGKPISDIITDTLNNKYRHHTHILVDGAKSKDGKTSYAIYIPSCNLYFGSKINDYYDIDTAEAAAILEAVHWIYTNKPAKALIISDSLGILKNIVENYSKTIPNIINNIYQKITQSSINITMLWIPAHCGYQQHDFVDSIAKQSLDSNIMTGIPPEIGMLNNLITNIEFEKWEKEWLQLKTGMSYKSSFQLQKFGYKK